MVGEQPYKSRDRLGAFARNYKLTKHEGHPRSTKLHFPKKIKEQRVEKHALDSRVHYNFRHLYSLGKKAF